MALIRSAKVQFHAATTTRDRYWGPKSSEKSLVWIAQKVSATQKLQLKPNFNNVFFYQTFSQPSFFIKKKLFSVY